MGRTSPARIVAVLLAISVIFGALPVVAVVLGLYLGFVVYMPAFRPMLKAKPLTPDS